MGDKWEHTALLVIDMEKDFIDGHVQVKGGKAIVPNVIEAVQIARQRGILVVWVVRENDPRGRDVELFRRQFYAAGKEGPAVKGKEGVELVDGLVIEEGDYKLVKTQFSAFFATHLDSSKSNGVDSLVVTGVQTPNCIRQTVFDGVALDYKSITVIVDATAAATTEVHAANIFDMKNVGAELQHQPCKNGQNWAPHPHCVNHYVIKLDFRNNMVLYSRRPMKDLVSSTSLTLKL